MSNLLVTIALSFAVIICAIALLCISWLITGKQKLKAGSCGKNPDQKKDKQCGTNIQCQLCDKNDAKKKKQDL